MKYFAKLEYAPRWVIWGIGLLMFAAVALADWATGPNFSFAIFYLIPIYFITWTLGTEAGVAMSIASLAAIIVADLGWEPPLRAAILDWERAAKFCFFLVTTVLLGRLREAYRNELEISRTDFLTGVANRREFYTVADTERERADRYGRILSLAYIDIDCFKEINDALGHSVGDNVLAAVGQILRNNVRTSDLVARMGGDEFVILLPETDETSARQAISKLLALLIEGVRESGWQITFSIGVVTFIHAPVSADVMIREADQLMYSVKRSGKNRIAHATYLRPMPTPVASA